MSLEKTDISEVMHEIAAGRLTTVTVPQRIDAEIETTTEFFVKELEKFKGNIREFSDCHGINAVYLVKSALLAVGNKELRLRWQRAVKLNTETRMDMLRDKALTMLEEYENKSSTSSAPDIAFCKTLLIGALTEDVSAARAKYYNQAPGEGELSVDDRDELDNLAGQV